MAINEFEVKDFLEEARSRYTEQFKDKIIFDKYVQLLLSTKIELQQTLKDLMQKRSIETAEGVQLDIIGEIVGQPRELIDASLISFFAFQGVIGAEGFGDTSNPTIGGNFYNFGDPTAGNVILNDEQYRLFIKAKIIRNSTAATPDQMIEFVSFLFGAPSAVIAEGNAEFTILFGRPLTQFERVMLNYVSTSQGFPTRIIPKPAGVRINFGEYLAENFFGFQGAPGAGGFGDYDGTFGYGAGYGIGYGSSDFDTTVGGYFATIY